MGPCRFSWAKNKCAILCTRRDIYNYQTPAGRHVPWESTRCLSAQPGNKKSGPSRGHGLVRRDQGSGPSQPCPSLLHPHLSICFKPSSTGLWKQAWVLACVAVKSCGSPLSHLPCGGRIPELHPLFRAKPVLQGAVQLTDRELPPCGWQCPTWCCRE